MDHTYWYGTVVPVCRVDGHIQCTDDSLTHVVSDCVNLDDGVHRGAAMWEPGHEEMRSIGEKEDVRVDNKLPV